MLIIRAVPRVIPVLCTCRYDVKYGSLGFNVFGYHGGCNFSLGTYEEALVAPESARYLCSDSEALEFQCLHDYSGEGVCYASDLWDGFYRSLPVRPYTHTQWNLCVLWYWLRFCELCPFCLHYHQVPMYHTHTQRKPPVQHAGHAFALSSQ